MTPRRLHRLTDRMSIRRRRASYRGRHRRAPLASITPATLSVLAILLVVVLVVLFLLAMSSVALAGPTDPPPLSALKSLPEVITGIRNWVIGILASIATLFL